MKTIIWRRFIPIGSKEEMDKFETLIEEKNLTREDLLIILRAIELNKNVKKQMEEVIT